MASNAMLSLVTSQQRTERRSADRIRMLLSATLVTPLDIYAVKLRDLSPAGAMVEGSSLPQEGTDVILKRGSLEIFASMVWVSGRRGGLEFEAPLCDIDFLGQINPPVPAATLSDQKMPMRKPGIAPVPLTAADLEAAKAWAIPVGREAYRD